MKKRANKNRKIIKDNSFFYSYAILLPLIILFNFFVYLLTPQIPGQPFFLRLHNNWHTKYINLDWKKELIYSNHFLSQDSGIISHGDRRNKQIALTFDADMTEGMAQMLESGKVESFYDYRLIEELRKTNTPATLFLTGMWTEVYPDQTKELAQDPLFEVGSHSYAHKAFANPCYYLEPLNQDEKIMDIGVSQFLIQKYSGSKVRLFRFPGGCYKSSDLLLLKQAGITAVQWDTVADDGFNPNPEAIISNVVKSTKNGSIIVMHMNGFPNEPVDYIAVPQIVKILREKGFEFVTVGKLLEGLGIMSK